jgi:hypothetical protein
MVPRQSREDRIHGAFGDFQAGNLSQLFDNLVAVCLVIAEHCHHAQFDKPFAKLSDPLLHAAPPADYYAMHCSGRA